MVGMYVSVLILFGGMWHVPIELLAPGKSGQRAVGISLFDGPTDYRAIHIVRRGNRTSTLNTRQKRECFLNE